MFFFLNLFFQKKTLKMSKGFFHHGREDEIFINLTIDDFSKEYFKQIDKRLDKAYIFQRKQEKNKYQFKGSIFRFSWNGWDLFNNISNGEIEFNEKNDKRYISHKIYFLEFFTIALIFTIIPVTMGGNWFLKLIVFFAIWLSYFTVYFISVYRFNSLIAKILIDVNSSTGYEFDNKNTTNPL